MMLKLNQNYCASVFCLIITFLIVNPAIPAWGVDNTDPSSAASARERFYKKYKDRVSKSRPDANPDVISGSQGVPSKARPSMEERRKQIEMKREERRKAHALRREDRRKKIGDANDRVEGKAADVSKKEKERLDARRKEMQERKAARIKEQREKIEKRRQAMKEKAAKHRKEMRDNPRLDPGAADYDDTAVDGRKMQDAVREKSSSGVDRMEELRKRREAMKEKARLHREALRSKRKSFRGNPDTGIDRPDGINPHVSGSTSPGIDDTARHPDPHISGSTGSGDRPHIGGAR